MVINRGWSEMETKIYYTLHLKVIEFFLHTSFSSFRSFVVAFLTRN